MGGLELLGIRARRGRRSAWATIASLAIATADDAAEIMAFVAGTDTRCRRCTTRRPDLVMERIDGPTMAAALVTGTLELSAGARILAELHDRLHALPARPAADRAIGSSISTCTPRT